MVWNSSNRFCGSSAGSVLVYTLSSHSSVRPVHVAGQRQGIRIAIELAGQVEGLLPDFQLVRNSRMSFRRAARKMSPRLG